MGVDTLRDKIADAVFEASTFQGDGNGGIIHDCRDEDATDRIIELVRAALLAPEVVEAAIGEMTAHDQDLLHEWTDDGGIATVQPILAAALDAAGLGGDGHE